MYGVFYMFRHYIAIFRECSWCLLRYDQLRSSDKIKKNEMGGACSTDWEERGVCRVLVGIPEGKRPLGDPDINGRIILRWIFRKWEVGLRTGLG
jgi:hypothetical protein